MILPPDEEIRTCTGPGGVEATRPLRNEVLGVVLFVEILICDQNDESFKQEA